MRSPELLSMTLMLVLSLATACAAADESPAANYFFAPPGSLSNQDRQKVLSDLSDINNIDPISLKSYDDQNGQIFTKIFGGPTTRDIQTYLNQRARYFADANDVGVNGQHIFATPQQAPTGATSGAQQGPSLIALNVGTMLWLASVAQNGHVAFTIDGVQPQPVPITSSRIGLIIMSPAYNSLPEVARQAVVIHEARHSDCTGGMPAKNLPAFRQAYLSGNSAALVPLANECGHMHIICPAGLYKGLPACDNESWGAYTVGGIYADAMAMNKSDPTAWAVAKQFAIDSKSRVMNQTGGEPDMSSAGVVNN
jgi:hypothetical protein